MERVSLNSTLCFNKPAVISLPNTPLPISRYIPLSLSPSRPLPPNPPNFPTNLPIRTMALLTGLIMKFLFSFLKKNYKSRHNVTHRRTRSASPPRRRRTQHHEPRRRTRSAETSGRRHRGGRVHGQGSREWRGEAPDQVQNARYREFCVRTGWPAEWGEEPGRERRGERR